jgi:hypothetical protein
MRSEKKNGDRQKVHLEEIEVINPLSFISIKAKKRIGVLFSHLWKLDTTNIGKIVPRCESAQPT